MEQQPQTEQTFDATSGLLDQKAIESRRNEPVEGAEKNQRLLLEARGGEGRNFGAKQTASCLQELPTLAEAHRQSQESQNNEFSDEAERFEHAT